jgi:hypothetical protein
MTTKVHSGTEAGMFAVGEFNGIRVEDQLSRKAEHALSMNFRDGPGGMSARADDGKVTHRDVIPNLELHTIAFPGMRRGDGLFQTQFHGSAGWNDESSRRGALLAECREGHQQDCDRPDAASLKLASA